MQRGWGLASVSACALAIVAAAPAGRTSGSPTSPPTPASASCTNPPPPRINTWSRPWVAAWRSLITTTTAASTCSSLTAQSFHDPMPDGKMPDKSDREILEPPVPAECRTGRSPTSRKGRVYRDASELLRHGRRGRRLRQRWLRGPVRHQLRRQHLYHNNGDGTFTDITGARGVGAGGWSASAGFFDSDNDGKLDLLVTRYVDWTFKTNRYCGEKKPGCRAYCHPDNYDGVTNILYHNNGDGTFTDVSTKAGIANPQWQGAWRRLCRLRWRRLH